MSIRKVIYPFFYHLRAFFELAFLPLVGLMLLGVTLSVMLMLATNPHPAGPVLLLGCTSGIAWLTLFRFYYPAILNWADTRRKTDTVVDLPFQSDTRNPNNK